MVTARLITVFDISSASSFLRFSSRRHSVPKVRERIKKDEAFRQLPALCRRASSSIGFFISLGKRYSEKTINGGEANPIKRKVLNKTNKNISIKNSRAMQEHFTFFGFRRKHFGRHCHKRRC